MGDGRSVGRSEHIFLQELNQRRQQRNRKKRWPSAPSARLDRMANERPPEADRRKMKGGDSHTRSASLPSDAESILHAAAAAAARRDTGRFKASHDARVSSSRLPPLPPTTDRQVDAAIGNRGYLQRKIDMV